MTKIRDHVTGGTKAPALIAWNLRSRASFSRARSASLMSSSASARQKSTSPSGSPGGASPVMRPLSTRTRIALISEEYSTSAPMGRKRPSVAMIRRHTRRFRGRSRCAGYLLAKCPRPVCGESHHPEHALGLLTLALQVRRQLDLGRQVASVGRRDDLVVVLGQGCSGTAACAASLRSEPPARSPSSCGVREGDLQGHHRPKSRRRQLAIPHKHRSHARPDALSRDTVGSPVVRTSRPPDYLVDDDRERLQLKGGARRGSTPGA